MREKTYAMLVQNMGRYVSGEAVSERLGVSRAAVSKHIRQFQEDGAQIDSVNNKGHRLLCHADRLKPEYVEPLLQSAPVRIVWHESVASTNNEAKALAVAGAPEFTCVTAEEQTGGRGRMGRVWQSPRHKGVYASFVLRPAIRAEDALGITVLAALSVCAVLRRMALPAKIKWPNDVLINGKKVCGILTEISASMDGVEYIVCGVGINANLGAGDIPAELRTIATSVYLEKGEAVARACLLADVLDAFYAYYLRFLQDGLKSMIGEYTQYSALHGKTVTLLSAGQEETGLFLGFDDQAALLVEIGGNVKKYIAGEISLRGF